VQEIAIVRSDASCGVGLRVGSSRKFDVQEWSRDFRVGPRSGRRAA
jgi:hypothetical protein